MKTFFKLPLVVAALAMAFIFSSCSNLFNNSEPNIVPTPTTETVSATNTEGNVAAATTDTNGNKTATLNAVNGSYTFTESLNANSNKGSNAAVDTTKSGVWFFTETGSSTPKYSGTYVGNISLLASETVTLTLTIQSVLDNGNIKPLSEAIEFSFTAALDAFLATIPQVTVIRNAVTELTYNSEELNDKLFTSKDNCNYLFTGNKCYQGGNLIDTRSLDFPVTDITIIKIENKLYKALKTTSGGTPTYYARERDELIFRETYKNVFTGKVFVDAERNRILAFRTRGQVFILNPPSPAPAPYGHQNYKVSGNTVAIEDGFGSYTLSGTTLISDQDNTVTLTQISGSNGFGGKAFYQDIPDFPPPDDTDFVWPFGFIIFESDTSVFIFHLRGFDSYVHTSYTVNGATATATVEVTQEDDTEDDTTVNKEITFTISDTTITAAFDSKSVTATLLQ